MHNAGDKHSFYVQQQEIDNYSKKQKENIGFSYELLDGNVGYLKVPGFLSTDNSVTNGFADQIQNAIATLDSNNNIIGWIVDLRNNSGGNMWPMILGLNPLIGTETAGYFKKLSKKPEAWKTTSPSNQVTLKRSYQVKNPNARIAVLFNNQTASSGEATAICFIGKPNSRSFGTPTAGLTTANDIFYLSEGNVFVLATSCEMDRNQQTYTGSLKPDILVENADEVEKAKAWVKGVQ